MEGFQFNLNLNLQIHIKEFLVELQTPPHELSWLLGANRTPMAQVPSNLEVSRINPIKF
jgi:hypothetical protein